MVDTDVVDTGDTDPVDTNLVDSDSDPIDTAPPETDPPGDSADTSDPVGAPDSADSAGLRDSGSVADSADSAGVADSADSADSAGGADSGDSADTGDTSIGSADSAADDSGDSGASDSAVPGETGLVDTVDTGPGESGFGTSDTVDSGVDTGDSGGTETGDSGPESLGTCATATPTAGFGTFFGSTLGLTDDYQAGCAASPSGDEVYTFVAPADGSVCVSSLGSDFDTVVYVRTDCEAGSSEIACNDDAPGLGLGVESQLQFEADAGSTYFVFIDGYGFATVRSEGNYQLDITDGPCPVLGGDTGDTGESGGVTDTQDTGDSGSITGGDTVDTGPVTGGDTVDSSTEDTAVTETADTAPPPLPPPAAPWTTFGGGFTPTYRILVDVYGNVVDITRAPVTVDVDFRAALDALGATGALNPDSIRVAYHGTSAAPSAGVEVPSQFADQLIGLGDKVDHASPVGDEEGTVAWLYDTDGVLGTANSLPAGGAELFGIYFDTGPAAPPIYFSDLSVSTNSLANVLTQASFDELGSGMLQSLTHAPFSPNLASQTASCCGNAVSVSPGGWSYGPQSGTATPEIVAGGPILGALRVQGSITTSGAESYDYDLYYYLFAGRSELLHVITHTASTAVTVFQNGDVTSGMRPWQSVHPDLAQTTLTFNQSAAEGWAAVTGADYGIAMGARVAPTFLTNVSNGNPGGVLFLKGNDVVDFGTGTTAVMAPGTSYFDNIELALFPYRGLFADHQDDFDAVRLGTPTFSWISESAP